MIQMFVSFPFTIASSGYTGTLSSQCLHRYEQLPAISSLFLWSDCSKLHYQSTSWIRFPCYCWSDCSDWTPSQETSKSIRMAEEGSWKRCKKDALECCWICSRLCSIWKCLFVTPPPASDTTAVPPSFESDFPFLPDKVDTGIVADPPHPHLPSTTASNPLQYITNTLLRQTLKNPPIELLQQFSIFF